MSRPTRARGLKLYISTSRATCERSRPTRARGLKPCRAGVGPIDKGSRPTRARGLKPAGNYLIDALKGRAPRGRVD